MCQKLTGLAEEAAIAKMTVADLVKGTKRSEGIVVGFSSPLPLVTSAPVGQCLPTGETGSCREGMGSRRRDEVL